jgi:hypothetical protein
MSKLESSIERKACKRAEDLMGVTSSKLVTPGEVGYPDRIVWLPISPIMIEFKKVGKDAEPRQHYIHEMLRNLGYEVFVVDNVMDALHIIRNALIERGIECEWNGV